MIRKWEKTKPFIYLINIITYNRHVERFMYHKPAPMTVRKNTSPITGDYHVMTPMKVSLDTDL